jgi:hypothetical protein
MSFLQLPSEIIIHIFDFIGSAYFCADLSRVTVSQQWSKYAVPACYREFDVTQKSLKRLMRSCHMETSVELIKKNMQVFNLKLMGFQDWADYRQEQDDIDWHFWETDSSRQVYRAWEAELRNDLVQLAATIRQSPRLRVFRLRATTQMHPRFPILNYSNYMDRDTLLSVSNLTVLDLDLGGGPNIVRRAQEHGEEFHLCAIVAKLLTTLQYLRLRMRSICADALKPHEHSTSLRLKEVLVNLSLDGELPGIGSDQYAQHCIPVRSLASAMEKQAKILVAQMADPKMVRILTHTRPWMQFRAFDVLTGRVLMLDRRVEWHDEGRVSEEEVWSDQGPVYPLHIPSSDMQGIVNADGDIVIL